MPYSCSIKNCPGNHESKYMICVNEDFSFRKLDEKPTISEVFMICNAYESGVGHGLQRDGLVNPYPEGKLHEAYQIGYDLGAERVSDKAGATP